MVPTVNCTVEQQAFWSHKQDHPATFSKINFGLVESMIMKNFEPRWTSKMQETARLSEARIWSLLEDKNDVGTQKLILMAIMLVLNSDWMFYCEFQDTIRAMWRRRELEKSQAENE